MAPAVGQADLADNLKVESDDVIGENAVRAVASSGAVAASDRVVCRLSCCSQPC